jgi:NAD(P)-dependent dehydrogenase (short-subunit alcohol dehydrogenase family)
MTSAVVTGSNGGIGSATVRAMEACGFAVRGIDVGDDPAEVFGVVCPGLIQTPMSRRAQNDSRIRGRLPELQPLTGDFGTPEGVARAVVYLATAPFVTGAVLTVDGGWTAR